MKKLFAILAISGAMVSCNNSDSDKTPAADTSNKMAPAADAAKTADSATKAIGDTANKMMNAIKDTAVKAMDKMKDAAADKMKDAANKMADKAKEKVKN